MKDNHNNIEKEEENEKDKENQIVINDQLAKKEEIKIDNLINSVFKDKSKKPEIIEKLRPFFSLKVIPQREIDRVYSAVEKIEPEKIDLIEVNEYKEEKYCEKNIYLQHNQNL